MSFQQRGRTVYNAERRMDSARGARAGDPPGGVGHFQAHDEHVERIARNESGRARSRSRDSRRVPRNRAARRRLGGGGRPVPAQPDPTRSPAILAVGWRRLTWRSIETRALMLPFEALNEAQWSAKHISARAAGITKAGARISMATRRKNNGSDFVPNASAASR